MTQTARPAITRAAVLATILGVVAVAPALASDYMPDAKVQTVIDEAISNYDSLGEVSFGNLTGQDARATLNPELVMVFNKTSLDLVATGVNDTWVDELWGLPVAQDRELSVVLQDIDRDGHAWLERVTNHPATGTEHVMHQLWQSHGPYIFVSGYYALDAHVQTVVDRAVQLYNSTGPAAFPQLNDQWTESGRHEIIFILNTTGIWTLIVNQQFPTHVGTTSTILHHILGNADLPEEGGIWLEGLGHGERRTWAYMLDGYAFTVTYDIRDAQAEAVVRNLVHLYNMSDTAAVIEMVQALNGTAEQFHPFILNGNGTYLAHGKDPNLVGETFTGGVLPVEGDIWTDRLGRLQEISDVLSDLPDEGGIWIDSTDFTRSTWLYHHDGLVFGTGYDRGWYQEN